MTEAPTEEQLVKMSELFDTVMMEFSEEFNVGPLSLSALFMARMVRLSQDLGYSTEFSELLKKISHMHETTQDFTQTMDTSTSIH